MSISNIIAPTPRKVKIINHVAKSPCQSCLRFIIRVALFRLNPEAPVVNDNMLSVVTVNVPIPVGLRVVPTTCATKEIATKRIQ